MKLVDLKGTVKARTGLAVLFSDGDKDAWLPLSQIEVEDLGKGLVEVTLPEWLAYEKELI